MTYFLYKKNYILKIQQELFFKKQLRMKIATRIMRMAAVES